MENDSGLNQQSTEFEWTICGCRKEIEAAKMVIQTEQQSLPKFGVKYSMLCEVQSLVRSGFCIKKESYVPVNFKLIAFPVQIAYKEGNFS